jgi:hypothetical protein
MTLSASCDFGTIGKIEAASVGGLNVLKNPSALFRYTFYGVAVERCPILVADRPGRFVVR